MSNECLTLIILLAEITYNDSWKELVVCGVHSEHIRTRCNFGNGIRKICGLVEVGVVGRMNGRFERGRRGQNKNSKTVIL